MATWLLQANPARWRIFDFLADGEVLRSWTVKRYLTQPVEGDRVVLWLTGASGGVIGLGKVTGAVEAVDTDNLDPYWTDSGPAEGAHRLPIAMDEYFLDTPIPRHALVADPVFADSAIIRSSQSSNPFPVTPEEWAVIQRLLDRDNDLDSDWDLAPGESIRRVDLHARYGGSGQNGISPSTRSPNVLIFTDSRSGHQHGYFDEWLGDDVFLYSGEGQTGDQTMTGGNKAILHHLADGRALRVFEGARGTVRYVGEFVIDTDLPYRIKQAPQRDSSDLRDVIQFRLLRLAEATHPTVQEELPTGATYRSQDEEGEVAPPSPARNPNPDASGRGLRAHRRLQNGLADAVRSAGGDPWSPAPHDPDFDIAWSPVTDHIVVVEVKSLTRVNEVRQLRLGLGQILDYHDSFNARFGTVTPVLYVQRQPTDLRWVAIAQRCGVLLSWPGNHAGVPGLSES